MSAIDKKYRINEVFYSLQAEGANAGRAAVFVRTAGCNMDCKFCDTNHTNYMELTGEELEREVVRLAPLGTLIVITGGEPTLQMDSEHPLFKGRYVAMETNGIITPPDWVNWVTISPKLKLPTAKLSCASELKFLHGQFEEKYLVEVGEWAQYLGIPCYIQPTASRSGHFDAAGAVEFVKAHPYWRLSLQFHKMINIR